MAQLLSSFSFFDLRGGVILVSVFVILCCVERFSPLRRRVEHWLRRAVINAVVAAPAMLALRLLLIPAVVTIATWSEAHRFGLVYWLKLPRPWGMIGSFLLLDYAMYGWHWLNHRVPFLWRFHEVHHSDLDLDVTTALRFHFGEMLLSVAVRSFEVLLIGANPATALVYEICLEVSTQFHHSNLKLPWALERVLSRFIMTPRAHGIHHSIVDRQTNSNYSNLLFCWDRLHGTLLLNVPQNAIVIGVPTHRDPHELTPLKLLFMPFGQQRRLRPRPEAAPKTVCSAKSNDERQQLLP